MNSEALPLILLSAGGTGGHMTPAQALARDLGRRGFRVELATDARGRKYAHMFGDIAVHVLPSGTAGAGLMGKIKGVFSLVLGIMKAFALVRRLKPAVVVGFGGYPSVPAVFAAQRLGMPTLIHEQNAIIGKANHFLAGRAARIAISMPSITGLDEIDRARIVETGNPVRPEISELFMEPYPVPQAEGKLRILIMGGSLGARVFSDVLPEAFAALPADYRARLDLVQQCRAEFIDTVRAQYEKAGIKAELHEFVQDVAGELKKAHLVIARSGASTVAEITAAGRPAIFVPYPYHKDQQQKMNADAVADAGGAWVMTESGFTPETLRARVETFLQNPKVLFKSAEAARSCGKPDAARKLGNVVTQLASGWKDDDSEDDGEKG
ncbi:MAG: undecaprenyldiphospho-muramoylpentapeptide beta-N-acetylglucosaminyltransferase [Alphaproteobacteria bacterium]|nr:undecaprenyldiphospho-muramoylpentapeptide beta-N-acetylglucosaminyltransferase [Alphaproteobacteria bacterium]MCD8569987.1 undecaprenyldiphospho-muramoylpentapeptide beta-N-acetylglucosaminyltransferase [Alphaproteobacteria bacterium]